MMRVKINNFNFKISISINQKWLPWLHQSKMVTLVQAASLSRMLDPKTFHERRSEAGRLTLLWITLKKTYFEENKLKLSQLYLSRYNTVGARIPNIRILNILKVCFRMVKRSDGPDHSKTKL